MTEVSICLQKTLYCDECGRVCSSSGALILNGMKYCRICYDKKTKSWIRRVLE